MRIIKPPKKRRVRTVVTVCLLVATAAAVTLYYAYGGPYWLLWIPILMVCDLVDIVLEKRGGRGGRPFRARRSHAILVGVASTFAGMLSIELAFNRGYGVFPVIGVLAVALAMYAAFKFVLRRRAVVQSAALRPCPHCGYERRDLGARTVCPECGRSPWL